MKYFSVVALALLVTAPTLAIQEEQQKQHSSTRGRKKQHEAQQEQHRSLKKSKKCKNIPDVLPDEYCTSSEPVCVSATGEELPLNVEVEGSYCVPCRNSRESDAEIDEGCDESKPRCVLTEDGTESPVLGFAGEFCLEEPMVNTSSLPDGDGLFHVCVSLQSGGFHFINSDRECASGMVRTSFSQVGPPGPQGDQGPTGLDGPQGPKGNTGPQGADGPQGPQGLRGDQGLQDLQGVQGLQGDTGPVGTDGADGLQGPTGPAGADGVDGADGPTGPEGPQGPEGPSMASAELITSMCNEYFLKLDICKKYIFVTGEGRDADFNTGTGLSTIEAVDAVCQETAESAGLPGLYYGWFSTSGSNDPGSRFHQSVVPYVRPDGITFAYNWDDLTDGQTEVGLFTDEFGRELTNSVDDFNSNSIPTNTRPNGNYRSGYGDCSNFTDATGGEGMDDSAGNIGHQNSTTTRLAINALVKCDRPIRFICVQQ